MKFEFEIKNLILERKDTNVVVDDTEEIICKFSFLTDEWKRKEKYIIFWNTKNKTKIMSLGKRSESECHIPKEILKESLFAIQIYVNDNLKTQKLNITLTPSNYTIQEDINKCNQKEKVTDNYNTKKIFDEILTKLDSKVTAISYENGYLKCYAGEDKLIYAEPIFTNIINDIKEIIINVNSEIDNIFLDNDKVICYSNNEIIYEIPFLTSLSDVAFSGDYNDLTNIPEEFNPSYHNHLVIDVVDYEENIEFDLNTLLDFLGDEINKE